MTKPGVEPDSGICASGQIHMGGFLFPFSSSMLGTEPRASFTLSRGSTTEPHNSALPFFMSSPQ